jgi:hypothetical protein
LAERARWVLLLLVAVLAGALAGCGEEGASEDATLTVYVSGPLQGPEAAQGQRRCDEARETVRIEHEPGDHWLRVVCLDASGPDGRWTLAKVGSNARRATEDSAAVAYVGEPDRQARRQSRPILEAAGIVEFGNSGGRQAIEEVFAALREDDSDDPRAAVYDAIEG